MIPYTRSNYYNNYVCIPSIIIFVAVAVVVVFVVVASHVIYVVLFGSDVPSQAYLCFIKFNYERVLVNQFSYKLCEVLKDAIFRRFSRIQYNTPIRGPRYQFRRES